MTCFWYLVECEQVFAVEEIFLLIVCGVKNICYSKSEFVKSTDRQLLF